MHFIIYRITNKINGKIYIGKHKCIKLDDRYFGSGKILKLAIQKYGRENFEMHMEIDLKSQEEMDLLEQCVINREFLKRTDVYNISRGGKNPCMYGEDNPFYGKTHTIEARKLISDANTGKIMSESSRQRISESLIKTFSEHPEYKEKCAVTRNKKKCISKITGEIKYIDKNNIPPGFEIYIHRKDRRLTKEQKTESSRRRSERASKSKWFNNGIKETFCKPECAPAGYVYGRLPDLNRGRKYSACTIEKMRLAKIGKTPPNINKIFITNGIENKYISRDEPIPAGWKRGMTRKNKRIKS